MGIDTKSLPEVPVPKERTGSPGGGVINSDKPTIIGQFETLVTKSHKTSYFQMSSSGQMILKLASWYGISPLLFCGLAAKAPGNLEGRELGVGRMHISKVERTISRYLHIVMLVMQDMAVPMLPFQKEGRKAAELFDKLTSSRDRFRHGISWNRLSTREPPDN